MSAKDELFDRIKYLDHAIGLPVMIDTGIAISDHNGAANILRKGIGIIAFNILEDFIKNKTIEALNQISNSGIEFSKLPPSLQEASILGALNALNFRTKLTKKDGGDWKDLAQTESLKIHSTKNENFEFSKFSLLSANPNISSAEITEVMKSFGIVGGWDKLKIVSDSINGGIPDLNQSYNNAATRRHNAAHSAAFRYEYSWLSGIKREILSISASFDILLSARCRQVDANLTRDIVVNNIDEALNFRFLEESSAHFRETKIINGRSRKNWPTERDALLVLKPNLKNKKEFLITLDRAKNIKDWHY